MLTLLAIWSISAVTSLPGLAVSPILGDLDKIFPTASDLEIQMLTSLPNLLIIPFVLLSGKISESSGKIPMLIFGLCLFLLCGIMYFFATTMNALIIISCFLGIGAGLIIPLSTGLIADVFSGEYRAEQFGLSSSITNITLVFSTLIAGWLANFNWHLPFVVYLLPVVCLGLCNYLRTKYMTNNTKTITDQKSQSVQNNNNTKYIQAGQAINKKLIFGLMIVYFLATYVCFIVTFNLPFVIQSYHLNTDYSGSFISILFLAIMIPGFFITRIIKWISDYAFMIGFGLLAIGLLFIVLFKNIVLIGFGTFIIGFGFGIIQPLIYNKTVLTARTEKAVLALAFVMVMNYVGLVTLPFIAEFFESLFHDKASVFPFLINSIMGALIAVASFIFRKDTLFSCNDLLN